MSICGPCSVGLYEECENPQPGIEGFVIPCGSLEMSESPKAKEERELRILEPDELTDDTSAGRKRAAMVAPILTGMVCEWAGLKFAGGGPFPILGCQNNTIAQVKSNEQAQAVGADEVGHIHHGPDKAVINNTAGVNLHRICTRCHNRWHALNDEHYGTRPHVSQPFTPVVPFYDHDSMTPYTSEELAIVEAWWATPKAKRGPYPFTPENVRVRSPRVEKPDTLPQNPFESLEIS